MLFHTGRPFKGKAGMDLLFVLSGFIFFSLWFSA